jgi:hypothetical protein
MLDADIIALAALFVSFIIFIGNVLGQIAVIQSQGRFQVEVGQRLKGLEEQFTRAREVRGHLLPVQYQHLEKIRDWFDNIFEFTVDTFVLTGAGPDVFEDYQARLQSLTVKSMSLAARVPYYMAIADLYDPLTEKNQEIDPRTKLPTALPALVLTGAKTMLQLNQLLETPDTEKMDEALGQAAFLGLSAAIAIERVRKQLTTA